MDLSRSQNVAPSCAQIPVFSKSVVRKLQHAKTDLESVLATKTYFIYSTTSTSGATGSSLPTTAYSPTQIDFSNRIDGFFGNMASAFDIFAQVLNKVYLTHPLRENEVTFDMMVRIMKIRFMNESLSQYLFGLPRQQWYRDLKSFRHCSTHRKVIECIVETTHGSIQTTFPTITRILLPDNPSLNTMTYVLQREFGKFGSNVLTNVLVSIDNMYGLLESRVRTANRIPV